MPRALKRIPVEHFDTMCRLQEVQGIGARKISKAMGGIYKYPFVSLILKECKDSDARRRRTSTNTNLEGTIATTVLQEMSVDPWAFEHGKEVGGPPSHGANNNWVSPDSYSQPSITPSLDFLDLRNQWSQGVPDPQNFESSLAGPSSYPEFVAPTPRVGISNSYENVVQSILQAKFVEWAWRQAFPPASSPKQENCKDGKPSDKEISTKNRTPWENKLKLEIEELTKKLQEVPAKQELTPTSITFAVAEETMTPPSRENAQTVQGETQEVSPFVEPKQPNVIENIAVEHDPNTQPPTITGEADDVRSQGPRDLSLETQSVSLQEPDAVILPPDHMAAKKAEAKTNDLGVDALFRREDQKEPPIASPLQKNATQFIKGRGKSDQLVILEKPGTWLEADELQNAGHPPSSEATVNTKTVLLNASRGSEETQSHLLTIPCYRIDHAGETALQHRTEAEQSMIHSDQTNDPSSSACVTNERRDSIPEPSTALSCQCAQSQSDPEEEEGWWVLPVIGLLGTGVVLVYEYLKEQSLT